MYQLHSHLWSVYELLQKQNPVPSGNDDLDASELRGTQVEDNEVEVEGSKSYVNDVDITDDQIGFFFHRTGSLFRVLLRERGSYIGLSNSVGTDRYYCGNCRHVMCSCVSQFLSNNVGTDRYYCGNRRCVKLASCCFFYIQSNRVWISMWQSPTQP